MAEPPKGKPIREWDFWDWLSMAFLALVAVALVGKVLQWVGLIDPPPPSAPRYEPPSFDRDECLNRNAYRIREADPMISDEMLAGDVARACVLEQQEFEGW